MWAMVPTLGWGEPLGKLYGRAVHSTSEALLLFGVT